MELFSDIIGTLGAIILLLAYYLLQVEKITAEKYQYHSMNLVGAVFVLISLTIKPNAPSILMEIFWALVAVYGLYKVRFLKR